jgi:nucleotidyltransferase AbiEii toxin of type IV toxin-antitoxin system
MDKWAKALTTDREALFIETAAQKNISPEIIEKDFWVCWTLLQISRLVELPRLIFKGGTSLSKAFGIIKRFSEDIDLVINRHELGFIRETDPANQEATNLRNRTIEKLKATCFDVIAQEFLPKLKSQMSSIIETDGWTLKIDTNASEPDTIEFQYPKGLPDSQVSNYIRRAVRLELGCRGDQIPCEEATVKSYAAEVKPNLFEIAEAPVFVISPERTFWEKATILHREYYRAEAGKELTERVFRHYDDLVVISKHVRGASAISAYSYLLDEVVSHKQHFFREGAARYELATRNTLKLAPGKRLEESLRKDYDKMKEMYFGSEPDFDAVMEAIRQLEKKINES